MGCEVGRELGWPVGFAEGAAVGLAVGNKLPVKFKEAKNGIFENAGIVPVNMFFRRSRD